MLLRVHLKNVKLLSEAEVAGSCTGLVRCRVSRLLACYIFTFNIARKNCLFVEGNFICDYMLQVVWVACPKVESKFTDISGFNNTITKQIEDMVMI